MAFDNETNWFFGLTTNGLSSPRKDFFSVAAHEFAHVLGFGTAESFQRLVDTENALFTGPAATAEFDNQGHPPLAPGPPADPDLGHFAIPTRDEGRRVAMEPSLRIGVRTPLRELDLAVRDLSMHLSIPLACADVGDWQDTDLVKDTITAPSAGRIKSKNNWDADIRLTDPNIDISLNQLYVKRNVTDTVVRTPRSINKIKAARLINTTIFAGVSDTVPDNQLPTGPTDFTAAAEIASIKVKAAKDQSIWLDNIHIAASTIGKAAAGFAAATGAHYGLAAATFNALSYRNAEGIFKLRATDSPLNTPGDTPIENDLIIRIIGLSRRLIPKSHPADH